MMDKHEMFQKFTLGPISTQKLRCTLLESLFLNGLLVNGAILIALGSRNSLLTEEHFRDYPQNISHTSLAMCINLDIVGGQFRFHIHHSILCLQSLQIAKKCACYRSFGSVISKLGHREKNWDKFVLHGLQHSSPVGHDSAKHLSMCINPSPFNRAFKYVF